MSEAIALQRPALTLPWRLLRLLPGIALLFSIGYAGKVAETMVRDYGKTHHLALPNIEYVLWAILLGLVISNTVGVAQIFRPGVHLRFLAEDGDRAARRALPARRRREAGRSLARAGGDRAGRRHRDHDGAGPLVQAQAQAHQPAGGGVVDLRRLGDHRGQGRDR